jgi:glycosyltransferase involved in cell wall biosynthesis
MTQANLRVEGPSISGRSAGPEGVSRRQDLDVSIVLACLNEEAAVAASVEKALRWLDECGLRGEVLVVDNGSTDSSRAEALRAGARVIDEPVRGYGAAHIRGFAEARGNVIVMADADDTYDLRHLDPLVAPLRDGYDMVVGNRLETLDPGAMTWTHRFIGTPAITFLLSLFTGSRIRDSQCGIRAFTRDAYERMELRSTGMELASEMVLKAARRGLRVGEVPVPYAVRQGESKLNTFRDGWRHLRFLLLNTPLYLFLIPGVISALLGVLALGITLAAERGVSVGSLTWQPVFAGSILLIIGANAIMIGVAAHLYAASRKIIPEDALTVAFNRAVTLERLLLGALLVILAGAVIDALIFYQWLSGNDVAGDTEGLAAVAQTLIIVGANLGLGGFLTALLMEER